MADRLDGDLPAIAALFFIHFDIKKGYTLRWHRSIPGVSIEGAVEYKSLPSGLHTVPEDLIYFVHDRYAGISAFLSTPATAKNRNALLLAVGVLVPRRSGRLGKCWQYAPSLKAFAKDIAAKEGNPDKPDDVFKHLERFWDGHQLQQIDHSQVPSSPIDSSVASRVGPGHSRGHARNQRSLTSETALLEFGSPVPSSHPASKLLEFMNDFGPLIFPLYRLALLRKRILFICHAPLEQACNFVYHLSILSNIPDIDGLSLQGTTKRLQPLFAIGIHDIPQLEEDARKTSEHARSLPAEGRGPSGSSVRGWVACTTDCILVDKRNLYDAIVHLPLPNKPGIARGWPRIESATGTSIRATQKDLRRYTTLRKSMLGSPDAVPHGTSSFVRKEEQTQDQLGDSDAVEPLSWSALAFSSLVWWASAGEQQTDVSSEMKADGALLEGLDELEPTSYPEINLEEPDSAREASISLFKGVLPLIVYFRRLTTSMLSAIVDIDREARELEDDDDDDRARMLRTGGEDVLTFRAADISRLGLDVWSDGDAAFVRDLISQYLGKEAQIEGFTVECCGLKVV